EGYSQRRDPLARRVDREARWAELIAAFIFDNAFPSGHADLDRELTRTVAALFGSVQGSDLSERLTKHLAASTSPIEDIHYLAVIARLRRDWPAGLRRQVADTLLSLDERIQRQRLNRDTHWPLRVAELYAGLAEKDASLHKTVLAHAAFGRPDHVLFTQ